jgi:membrane peptidoglycan carboxypeptidase
VAEKLQKGRGSGRGPRPKADPDATRLQRVIAWNKQRREAKKRRLARMSRPKRVTRRVAIVGTWLLGLFTALLVAAVVLFYALSDVPRPDTIKLPQVATMLYSNGHVMAKFGTQNRTIVPLSKVPSYVKWEVVGAEDRNFYSEPGVSIKGTLRAAFADVFGGDSQGGSGITQQYAKNAYLSDARTLTRKLKELMIAIKLSREYSKDQILGFYLNSVYFGRGAYGIQAAAQTYFGKDISKVSVAEGAVLVALLRAPSYYDPANNIAAAKDRWQYVISSMVSIHKLTQQQADALTYPRVLPPKDQPTLGASGPTYFIYEQVLHELAAHGISLDDVEKRGMTITTTIDQKAQQAALTAIHDTFGNLTKQQRNMKNALVAVSPKSGAVLAYYGGPNGKGYDGKPDYNDYAGVGSRPPGSSFKPYTLATVLTQTLTKTPGKPPTTISSDVDGSQCVMIQGKKICNDPSDAPYSGSSVKLSYAMKYSLNTTFDLLAVQAGPNNVAHTAHEMGIAAKINGTPTLQDGDGNTGFDIGIGGYAVRPIDQAVGFATFADGGLVNGSYFVSKVTDSNGNVVYEHHSSPRRAIDPRVANDVTLTLEPIASSSGFPLSDGRVSAAKTGTQGIPNSPENANSDAWTVGYTPQVSAAVWVGSGDSTHPIYNADGGAEYGRDLPGSTWKAFMDAYLAGQPKLPMATKQEVFPGGKAAPTTSAAPAPTTRASSSSPKPTFTLKTGFSSTAPTPSPTPTTSSSPPPITVSIPPPTSSSAATTSPPASSSSAAPPKSCGGALNPCPTG